ncbi:MAG: hypothetical protein ACOCWQ_00345 [Nanoarchaeota archaeon]
MADLLNLGKLILLCFACLSIASCAAGPADSGIATYRTGDQALEFQVIHNPYEVYDGDDLSLLLEVRNRGTYDVTGGAIYIKGYDPKYLPGLYIDPTPVLNIEGKDEFDPTGELTQVYEISVPSVRAPRHKDILTQTLNIVACYPYVTRGSYEVCVDPDPANRRIGSKVCQGGTAAAGAQGHPVAVTSIQQKVSRNDIRFMLTISNVGDGLVYSNHLTPEACAYDLDRVDIDTFTVRKVEFSGKLLRCDPQNPVRFTRGGSALVTCICENCVNIDQGAYKTVLNVELGYGYRNDLQETVKIVQP